MGPMGWDGTTCKSHGMGWDEKFFLTNGMGWDGMNWLVPWDEFSVPSHPIRSPDCYYFACVDSIYQCGEGNLLVQVSYPLCKLACFWTFFLNKQNDFVR